MQRTGVTRKLKPRGSESARSWRGRQGTDHGQHGKPARFRIQVEDPIIRAIGSHDRIWGSGDIIRFLFQKGNIKNRSASKYSEGLPSSGKETIIG